jgi:hypothetical protein
MSGFVAVQCPHLEATYRAGAKDMPHPIFIENPIFDRKFVPNIATDHHPES